MIRQDYDRHYINGQGSLDGLMFYAIPAHASPDGVEKICPIDQTSLGEIAPSVCARGVGPRQTSSLWNIGPTGRCFKTNPQHTRPLSGANLSSGVRKCVSSGGPTPADLWSPRRARAHETQEWKRVGDRAGPYVCAKQTRQGGGWPNVEPRRRVGWWVGWKGWEGRATSLASRLLMPSRLRLSVINLIEALFLVDCGSKRKRRRG